MVQCGLPRMTTERPREIGLFGEGDHAADELFDVARSAQDCTLARHGGAVYRVLRPQSRRQDLSDLFEIAGDDPAAERHVFEYLGRRPEKLAVDHVGAVRRHVDVARLEQPRALNLWHPSGEDDPLFE